MAYTDTGKNLMQDALASAITEASLHEANPGESGSGEISGGSYARQSIAFNAASGGEITLDGQPVFDVPGGATINHVGFWAGTDFVAYGSITEETYGADGTYTLTAADLDLNAA